MNGYIRCWCVCTERCHWWIRPESTNQLLRVNGGTCSYTWQRLAPLQAERGTTCSTAACGWCQATWRSASCHQPEDSFKPAGGSRWEETVVPGVSSIVVDLQITSDLPLRDVMGRYGKHPPWEVKVYRSGLVVDASCDHGWHWYEQQQQETDNRLHSVCDGCQVWSVKMLENVNPYLPPTSSLARRLAYTRAHTLHVHHTRMLVLTYSKRKKEWIRRGWELDILRKSMNTETQSAVVSLYT